MNHPEDPLDALLRRHAPPPVADEGFSERTLAALDVSFDAARALEQERRHWAALGRRWRWSGIGVVAGGVLFAGVAALSPGDVLRLEIPTEAPGSLPLGLVMMAGALWYAWSALRRS